MYVCMYVCMYIHVHVYTHVHVHVDMYIHVSEPQLYIQVNEKICNLEREYRDCIKS